ncbi:hypothetical protein FIBSPDRAFT_966728 [Athelia psychrophila]|uniref:Uncharacterized protein n=1 Tax=Athelia psychrophila TaxID=1759441 RepID=A0A167WGY4_9AGAM|nr:hypothetical protein FIBSPDRAFT_966728 [Fibularhizoctonia sp. CBS 109695]
MSRGLSDGCHVVDRTERLTRPAAARQPPAYSTLWVSPSVLQQRKAMVKYTTFWGLIPPMFTMVPSITTFVAGTTALRATCTAPNSVRTDPSADTGDDTEGPSVGEGQAVSSLDSSAMVAPIAPPSLPPPVRKAGRITKNAKLILARLKHSLSSRKRT